MTGPVYHCVFAGGFKKGEESFYDLFLDKVWVFYFFPGTICIHLPCICNGLELEPVMLHGICYIWHVYLPCCTVFTSTSHLAWYLLHVGSSNVHVGFFRDL